MATPASLRPTTPDAARRRFDARLRTLVAASLLVAACGTPAPPAATSSSTGPSAVPTATSGPVASGSATATAGAVASVPAEGSLSGVIVDIEQENPVTITSFVLRTESGADVRFAVGELDVSGDAFPAVHLREHLATTQPVIVDFVTRDGVLTAVRLVDDPR